MYFLPINDTMWSLRLLIKGIRPKVAFNSLVSRLEFGKINFAALRCSPSRASELTFPHPCQANQYSKIGKIIVLQRRSAAAMGIEILRRLRTPLDLLTTRLIWFLKLKCLSIMIPRYLKESDSIKVRRSSTG